jgi:hypothetical protein
LGEYGKDNLLAGCSTQVNSRMLCSSSVAARLHEIYRECLEHSSWARIVLETSRERISFSCRKPPTASPFQQQGRKRPATAKKRERNRRRLEEWLERKNHRSQTSPSAAVAESTAAEVTSYATAALKPTVSSPALSDSVATASDKGTTAVSAPAAVKAAAATTAATEAVKPPPKHLKTKAAATRASERPSVVAKRRNLLQLDGCDTSAVSSKESLQKPTAATSPDPPGNPAAAPTTAPSPAPEPPDGHILCSICRIHSHDWVYSRCKLFRTKN